MRAGRLGPARPSVPATKAVILFGVGPHRMAIGAADVKEIRKDRDLAPAEIGCHSILSAHALFGVPPGQEARLLVLRGGQVAVRVDRVERMVETGALRPLPRAFQGAERAWYSGLVLADGTVVPLLNPETMEREARRQEDESFDAAWALVEPPQKTSQPGAQPWQER